MFASAIVQAVVDKIKGVLSKAEPLLDGELTPDTEKYAEALKEHDDGAERVVRSMDYYRTTRRSSRSRLKALETQRTFFMNNKHRMEYARFSRNGWPIGSGPVEAACKSVVKTRLCRSGMRWSRPGGQHILTLRTYVKSDRWDAMWHKYKQRRCAA